jgi:hypothetical protein
VAVGSGAVVLATSGPVGVVGGVVVVLGQEGVVAGSAVMPGPEEVGAGVGGGDDAGVASGVADGVVSAVGVVGGGAVVLLPTVDVGSLRTHWCWTFGLASGGVTAGVPCQRRATPAQLGCLGHGDPPR